MSDGDHYVECCEHGKQQATYVCQHIVQSLHDGESRGFWSSEESSDNSRPDSWCSACEDVVNRVGGWNDESEAFAGVRLLCGACYDRANNYWLEWFHSAQEKLEADEPTFEYHPDMLPPIMYTDEARRLLAACERAWVFGGMGSWNDLGFAEGELQRRYGTLTPELYAAVLDGVAAATNQEFV